MTDFETITVPARLCGYPGVAFGGYVAGTLAARAAAPTVRVDFRRPVPTDSPVRLAATAGGGTELTDGTALLAAAVPAEPAVEAPPAPSWEQASAAADAFRAAPPDGGVDCFGCGLDRTPDTGLRLHCGLVPGTGLVAAAWTPGPALAGADGLLPPELVWGALDCPGNAAGRLLDGRKAGAVTAALTARLLRPVPVGAGVVSYAWLLGSEGRKYRAGTALATADGELCALGEALWVEPRG
ncbi:hotdog fold domain-containing protein [Streptomyces sp. NPDC032472]|uniref:hotdog fold domain-containing protein n=1 Tax=Streptomyces sp. NPDC032472 TaxID=3155018 RepID=UPI0033DD5533